MNRTMTMWAMAALLVGASLVAAPGAAMAERGGKWWTPRQSGDRRAERVYRREAGPRPFTRQYRSWGGRRIYREGILIRASRGPRYRAWRTYCPPEYVYSRHIIRVRPVRFVVSASGFIGGVGFHGSYYRDDDDLYGCNFCDARFDSYGAYHTHVESCPHRPHGYRVECSDWDTGARWDDGGWCDDRDYRAGGDWRDRDYRDGGDWRDRDDRDDSGWRDRRGDDRDDDFDDDYDR